MTCSLFFTCFVTVVLLLCDIYFTFFIHSRFVEPVGLFTERFNKYKRCFLIYMRTNGLLSAIVLGLG